MRILFRSVLFCYTFYVMCMERKNGFCILDFHKIIRTIPRNQEGNIYVFLLDGKEYFFKECEEKECYVELFCEQVARFLGISTVHYDLARMENMTGVFSEGFNPNHCMETSLKEILEIFYHDVVCNYTDDFSHAFFVENTFNLENIWEALDYYFRDYKDKNIVVSRIMKQLVDSFILQICTGNSDLHYLNLTVLNEEEPILAPNYDYEKCDSVLSSLNTYTLQVSPLRFFSKNDGITTILKFLQFSSCEYKEYFLKKVSLMPSPFEIFSKIEDQLLIPIPSFIKEILSSKYLEEKEKIENVILEFQESNFRKR